MSGIVTRDASKPHDQPAKGPLALGIETPGGTHRLAALREKTAPSLFVRTGEIGSPSCRPARRSARKVPVAGTCRRCGQAIAGRSDKLFCSRSCKVNDRHRRTRPRVTGQPLEVLCRACGRPFVQSRRPGRPRAYCPTCRDSTRRTDGPTR